jgi:hypothetical protein
MKRATAVVMPAPADLNGAAERILEKYLTVAQAADFLCVSEACIRRYLTDKRLRRFKCGARTLVRARDCEALIVEG